MYFDPGKVAQVGKKIDTVVSLLPRLADEAVAPSVSMYGKILLYSAQMVEPTVTNSRVTLFKGMAAAGESIEEGLEQTIKNYQETEQASVDQVARLTKLIEELWG